MHSNCVNRGSDCIEQLTRCGRKKAGPNEVCSPRTATCIQATNKSPYTHASKTTSVSLTRGRNQHVTYGAVRRPSRFWDTPRHLPSGEWTRQFQMSSGGSEHAIHSASNMRPTVVPTIYFLPSAQGLPRRAARTICGAQMDE